MLDIRFIRQHPDLVKAGAAKKHIPVDIDRLLEVDEERRALLAQVDALRAERNAASGRIAQMKDEEKQQAIAEMKKVSAQIKTLEEGLRSVEEQYDALMLSVPNVPADEVPEGETDADNVEVRRWGAPPRFDFEPRDHVDLGESLDLIDIPRGVKLSGTRCYFLKNEGALLELAVCKFALDLIVRKGFTPMITPLFVRDEAMIGTGYFPWGRDQVYSLQGEDPALHLIGTSEVTVASYHYDEILQQDRLPLYYAGFTSCFRREAGTYGKDTRGLYRIHQFQKVEQVVVCKNDPGASLSELEHLVGNAEEVLQALEIPYRVVNVCGGELGAPQVRKYDIECWMHSRAAYGETHSCSMFHEFQARRLKLRYRDEAGKVQFAHTLNNTLIASPRILIPLLENNQQQDGSVLIPKVLRAYMGGQEMIEPKR
jgi:seryl-tRNA synthetase